MCTGAMKDTGRPRLVVGDEGTSSVAYTEPETSEGLMCALDLVLEPDRTEAP